jgi:F0F1-type ATP synthase membrane subunit c/vacuolar-type H+-ATPase subunit K
METTGLIMTKKQLLIALIIIEAVLLVGLVVAL